MRIILFILIILVFVSSLDAQINLTNGLVGYYPFSGNANDASGNNYNGILRNGVTFTNDRAGSGNSAAYFDGDDDYIEIPNNGAFSPRKAFSFVLQFKTESPAIQTLLDKRDLVTGTDIQLQAFINWDQQPGFGYGHHYTNNAECNIAVLQYNLYVRTGVNTINQNEWYCVIGVFDGNKQSIYLNGVLMDSKNSPLPLIDSCRNIPFIIGRHSNDYKQSFKGAIDEVRIYNRALTQDEINLLSPCKITTAEICDNGIDDDGDGLTDCTDPDCLSCESPCGPTPTISPKIFNTATNGKGGVISLGSKDLHWKVSDALNGPQRDAIFTGNCVPGYWHPSPFTDAGWITDSQLGNCGILYPQSSTSPRYFTTTFNVPASLVSSLKLSFDVYADNYINEVYLNGNPLGISKTSGDVFCTGCNISFTLNTGFVAGVNTLSFLITQLPVPDASPPVQYLGFLLHASASIDTDSDGVPDEKDFCPGTALGAEVDSRGCYAIRILKNDARCEGDSLVLEVPDAGTGSTYKWFLPGNQIMTGKKITIKNITITNNGKYLIEVTDNNNCIKKDSINISISLKPVVNILNPGKVCLGDSIQLSATGGSNYYWSPVEGLNNRFISSPKASPMSNTTYKVVIANNFGCVDSLSTLVQILPLPVITITGLKEICQGDSLQLTASGGINYKWKPNTSISNPYIHNPFLKPLNSTDYLLTVSNVEGCYDSVNVNIVVNPLPAINISPNQIICSPDSVQLTSYGGNSYLWTPATGLSNTLISNPKALPMVTTVYKVIVTTDKLCMDSAVTVITVNPTPQINIQKSNDIDCSNTTAEISITGSKKVVWTPSTYVDNPNATTITVNPDLTTTFFANWEDQNGCTGQDSIKIEVKNSGNLLYLLPNTFTPNNDNINDCFGLRKWGGIHLIEFSIFNRWGEKVFSTNNPNKCWDGTYKGVQQPIGTFVYFVKAKTFCGDIFRKGSVTIIR